MPSRTCSHPGSDGPHQGRRLLAQPDGVEVRADGVERVGLRSTKVAEAAPRESASTPSAPLPQNRSTTWSPSTPPDEPRMSKIGLAHPVRRRPHRGRELGGQPAPAAPASDDPHRAHPTASAGLLATVPTVDSPWRHAPGPTGPVEHPASHAAYRDRPGPGPCAPGRQLLNRYSPSSSLSSSLTSSARPGCACELRVLVDQGLGHPARLLQQRQVARVGQRRQPQVALALLAGAEQRALAPDAQVRLGQGEAVGRAGHRGQALVALLAAEQVAPAGVRRPARPGPAAGAAGRSRSGRRSRPP